MDLHEQRMQCLKMAFELGGKPEAVLSAAQQLLDFLAVEPKAASHQEVTATVPAVEETVNEPTIPQEAMSDPIAACGTALIMHEGQDLADAVPALDPPTTDSPEEIASIATSIETAPIAAEEAQQSVGEDDVSIAVPDGEPATDTPAQAEMSAAAEQSPTVVEAPKDEVASSE